MMVMMVGTVKGIIPYRYQISLNIHTLWQTNIVFENGHL
jgi:hypothetical protein